MHTFFSTLNRPSIPSAIPERAGVFPSRNNRYSLRPSLAKGLKEREISIESANTESSLQICSVPPHQQTQLQSLKALEHWACQNWRPKWRMAVLETRDREQGIGKPGSNRAGPQLQL